MPRKKHHKKQSLFELTSTQNDDDLQKLIKAGKIHYEVREWIRTWIKPDMNLLDITTKIENEVKLRSNYDVNNPLAGGLAFPVSLSINNCAAHYGSLNGEHNILKKDDICKIDFGIHFDGHLVDSAFTITFDEKYDKLIECAKEATNKGVSLIAPDMIVGEIGEQIQEIIESYEIELNGKTYKLKPINDLCGHSLDRFKIHTGIPIPNIKPDHKTEHLNTIKVEPNKLYAIEPYPTTGSGHVFSKPVCSHFCYNYFEHNLDEKFLLSGQEQKLLQNIKQNYNTLPFNKRWLDDILNANQTMTIFRLVKKGVLTDFPPLYDIDGSYNAQFENTVFLGNNEKKIVLTKGNDF
mgnify:CR=1 FL=1|jgi:methionyl aminopeptidase